MIAKTKRFLKTLYFKLFKINDTPQKIALGLGLGVFSGITPGIGPLTALFLAFLFRANRASALLGTLVTNTWTSLLTFILSIKIGSAIIGVSWKDVYQAWMLLVKDFHFYRLFNLSVLQIILPVALGYLVISAVLSIVAYLLTLLIFTLKKNENKSRAELPR
jgi:uncharacterized protein (DUF2062 family)